MTEADEEQLQESFKKLQTNGFSVPDLGKCPKCGKKLVLNNVYAGRYDEKGYLKTWTEYQNWLQNTLNHKMVLLEMGRGTVFLRLYVPLLRESLCFNKKQTFIV